MKYDDIKTPNDLYMFMKDNIKFGFLNQNNEILLRNKTNEVIFMDELFRHYYFQSPERALWNKCGICFDQNELMKYWLLNNNYDAKTYYTTIRNHAILVYIKDDKYYWIERTYAEAKGIHEYDNFNELINDYIICQNTDDQEIEIYEYNNINYGLDFYDFITTVKNNGKLIKKIIRL